MYKAIAIIITVATFGATVYFLSRGSGTSQTAIVSTSTQTTGQTISQTAGNRNQNRWGQPSNAGPTASTATKTS